MRESVEESIFSELIAEISEFYLSAESSITCIGIFQKLVLLQSSKNFLLTVVAMLYTPDCNVTEMELLTNLRKFQQISRKELSNEVFTAQSYHFYTNTNI